VRFVGVYETNEDIEEIRTSWVTTLKEILLGRDRVAGGRPAVMRMSKPYGVAVDSAGRVLVADSEQARVHVFDVAGRRYATLGGDGRAVRLRVPMGLAVDASGNIYVGDNGHGLILIFGADLQYRGVLGSPGDVQTPTGLAVDAGAGRLYAVDTRRHALVAYDLSSGRLVKRIGAMGARPGEFGYPSGVAVGPAGSVYVSDTMNYRVQVFDRNLAFLRAFGSLGANPGQFRRPKGIAVDHDNVVYVVDSDFNNFQMFDGRGRTLLAVGELGSRTGQMMLPAGIVVVPAQRRIYVAEQINRRIQVFERIG
jgi:DNA-binding beta-propeller fold protein YncE